MSELQEEWNIGTIIIFIIINAIMIPFTWISEGFIFMLWIFFPFNLIMIPYFYFSSSDNSSCYGCGRGGSELKNIWCYSNSRWYDDYFSKPCKKTKLHCVNCHNDSTWKNIGGY